MPCVYVDPDHIARTTERLLFRARKAASIGDVDSDLDAPWRIGVGALRSPRENASQGRDPR